MLTERRKKFIEAYRGNATEAARIAGFRNPGVMGCRLMKDKDIIDAIRARQQQEKRGLIADRHARQRFWTRVMNDENAEMRDRLKASELLGRSEADFTDNVHPVANLPALLAELDGRRGDGDDR